MSGRKQSSIQTEIWEGFLEEWGLGQPTAAISGTGSPAALVLSLSAFCPPCSGSLHGPELGAL